MSELTKPARRALPALGGPSDLASAAVVVLSAAWLGLRPFAEPDVWWHLRVGAEVRRTRSVTFDPDPWAAFADRPYVVTQWLPEAVASWVHDHVGLGGLLWLRTVLILALGAIVWVCCRRTAGALMSAVVTVGVLLASSPSLNPRPQLLSFVFFAVVVLAWRATAGDHRPRWWLVPVHWGWACCHGLWTFGLLFAGLTLLAIVLDGRDRPSRREVVSLGALVAACAAVTVVTPLGLTAWTAPFAVADNAAAVVKEWQFPPLTVAAVQVAWLLFLAAVVAVSRHRRPALWELAHLLFAAGCLLWMWRLVPLAVIAVAPLAAAVRDRLRREAAAQADPRAPRAMAAVVTLVAVAALLPALARGDDSSRYPAAMNRADAALDCLPRGTVVFNSFGLGGWLLWRHPDLVPVVDLRIEIYPAYHLDGYFHARDADPGWEQFVSRTGAGAALLTRDSVLRGPLGDSGWQVVTDEPGGVLLVPPGATREAISRCR
jgi:hypothetical protein